MFQIATESSSQKSQQQQLKRGQKVNCNSVSHFIDFI